MATGTAGRSMKHKLLSGLPVSVRRQLLYTRAHRTALRLKHPQTFSAKVNWRMVNDRRSLLVGTCDKLQMKEYAERVAGDLVRMPKTFWHGEDLRELSEVPLPATWVLKPTHRSSRIHFGEGAPDIPRLQATTAEWLDEFHWRVYGEWAYGQASRQFLVEETIGTPGDPPEDYKFFVFDGEPSFIQVDGARFRAHTRRFYTPSWEPVDVKNVYPLGDLDERPAELETMLEAAKRLGAPFDFCRIDLYAVDGVVWSGETSPYPGGGLEPFEPRTFDEHLGSLWTLPAV